MNVTSLLIHLISALIMHATSTVGNLTSKLIQFESSLLVTKTVNSKLIKRVYFTSEGFHSQEQCSRRECLDVAGMQSCGNSKNFQSIFCGVLGELMSFVTQTILKIAIGLREAAPLSNAVAEGSLSKF